MCFNKLLHPSLQINTFLRVFKVHCPVIISLMKAIGLVTRWGRLKHCAELNAPPELVEWTVNTPYQTCIHSVAFCNFPPSGFSSLWLCHRMFLWRIQNAHSFEWGKCKMIIGSLLQRRRITWFVRYEIIFWKSVQAGAANWANSLLYLFILDCHNITQIRNFKYLKKIKFKS